MAIDAVFPMFRSFAAINDLPGAVMPLVDPLPIAHSEEVAQVAKFFESTLGFPPNSVLTMQRRPEHGWQAGKHQASGPGP